MFIIIIYEKIKSIFFVSPVVIPEDVVVRGPAGSLDALVGAQIEVKLGGMCDANVDRGPSRDVSRLAALLLLVSAE